MRSSRRLMAKMDPPYRKSRRLKTRVGPLWRKNRTLLLSRTGDRQLEVCLMCQQRQMTGGMSVGQQGLLTGDHEQVSAQLLNGNLK